MGIIQVTSVDPSLRNFGMARMMLDTDTLRFAIEDLVLIETEKQSGKVVRQNSDDLRRSKEIVTAFHKMCEGSTFCFAEIPSGAQSARAAYSFGVAVGVIAGCPIPVIQVQNFEAKIAAVGSKNASKDDMIAWATRMYPDAPWKFHGVKLTNNNEHLADAVAIAHAGIQTEEFQRFLAMWKATASQAA